MVMTLVSLTISAQPQTLQSMRTAAGVKAHISVHQGSLSVYGAGICENFIGKVYSDSTTHLIIGKNWSAFLEYNEAGLLLHLVLTVNFHQTYIFYDRSVTIPHVNDCNES